MVNFVLTVVVVIAFLVFLLVLGCSESNSNRRLRLERMFTDKFYRNMMREWFAKYPEYWTDSRQKEVLGRIDIHYKGMFPTDAFERLYRESSAFKDFINRVIGGNME